MIVGSIVVVCMCVLFVDGVAAQGLCPEELPTPWTGPTLYSGGMHFSVLGSVSRSIAVFRRLNNLPDLKWPESINFYPWPWPEDPRRVSELEWLRLTAAAAITGEVSMFEQYRPRANPDMYSTYEPLPAVALDLGTAPAAPLDWWLRPTPDDQWTARQKAVHQLAGEVELIDWLQTTVTSSHASWVFEWALVPTSDDAYPEWGAVFKHAVARWKGGDGLEWAAAALEVAPPRQKGVAIPRDEQGEPWFDYTVVDDLLALYKTLIAKVESCTATPAEATAALAMAASAHAHGAPPTLLRTFLSRSLEAVVDITKKGLRRAVIERRDITPWLELVKAIDGQGAPGDHEDLRMIARFARFLTAKTFEEAIAVYDGRPLDLEAEYIINLLPYKTLAQLAARRTWTIEMRALVARAALARAWALGKTDAALGVLPVVGQTNPELAANISEIQKHPDRVARERALVMLILRAPRMNMELASAIMGIDTIYVWGAQETLHQTLFSINHMRHSLLNWWCPVRQESARRQHVVYGIDTLLRLSSGSSYRHIRGYVDWEIGRHESSSFRSRTRFELSPELAANRSELVKTHPVLRLADDRELLALSRVQSAPQALTRKVLDWAQDSAARTSRASRFIRDGDVAEALHLAIRATRFGCPSVNGYGRLSREAFMLLHSRWGHTAWAARTPYWFNSVIPYSPITVPLAYGPIALYAAHEKVAGVAQDEWIQRYWTWVRSFSPAENPSADRAGIRCDAGQSGPVWFLTGMREAGQVERRCEIPAGKIVLVPLINTLAQPSAGTAVTCDTLRRSLSPFVRSVKNLNLKVDDLSIQNLERFTRNSDCFALNDASSNISGPAASTGYWAFIKPLRKGWHEIRFGGTLPQDGFYQDVRYVLHVR